MVVHACNPSTCEAKDRGFKATLVLPSELQAILGCIKPCLWNQNQKENITQMFSALNKNCHGETSWDPFQFLGFIILAMRSIRDDFELMAIT